MFDTAQYTALTSKPVNHPGTPTPAVAIIPARYNSTRLNGKPLLEIAGRPMILHVVERALAAETIGRVIVATDDERIYAAVRDAGYEAAMTRPDHPTGSDRLAEVAARIHDTEIIVNVQGDEPLISPQTIERAVSEMIERKEADVVTTCEPMMSASEVLSPDVVKVVTNEAGRAIYFSRAPVPFPRDAVRQHKTLEAALEAEPALLNNFRKHTGLYVYRRRFLLEYASWTATALENTEALEQLRMLERGATIHVVESAAPSIGVDTREDYERVRKIIEEA
jgi:3-deoxy-manno-octulosonate cytidylyltransferase (CMP-KDO synthetase)